MRRTVYIGTILYFHSLFDTSDEFPKLPLNIVFNDRSATIKYRVVRHSVLEVALLEVGRFFLELLERIQSTFLKSELAIPNKTAGTIPFAVGFGLEGRL